MASLVIGKFQGIDRHSSEIDISPEVSRQLKNFSTTDKPGALSKSGTYADVASTLFGSTLPASITWKNFGEIPLTLPENRDIYLFHGQDGSSNHHLYVSKYWNGSAFVSGFLKLTEVEGPYTVDTITTNVELTDSELSSSVDDYYNGWTVTLTNAAAGLTMSAIVTDYTGSSKTLQLKNRTFGFGGVAAASGDTYYISRYILLATGVSGIDEIDDIIRFSGRENAVIGMTGNENQYPTQYQIWYGYINRAYSSGGTAQTFNDFSLDTEQLGKPYITANPPTNRQGVITAGAVSGGSLTAGTWNLYVAYEYDDFQIGPLSDAYSVSVSAGPNQTLAVTFSLPVNGTWNGTTSRFIQAYTTDSVPVEYSPYLLSRRVTGIYVFANSPADAEINLINTGGFTSVNPVKIMSSDSADNNTVFDANINYVGIATSATGVISFDADPTGPTYLELVGQTGVKPNFKYGVALDDHFIAAGIRTEDGERKNNHLIASVVDGSGVATPDNFGASNVINLGFYGSKEITGLRVIGDVPTSTSPKRRLLVATDDDVYILTLTSGDTFSFNLDRIGNKEGIIAPDAIVAAEGLIFGVSRNGFRVYTETGTQIIGEGLKDDFDALTAPASVVGAYFKRTRQVVFFFYTDQKVFAVDLLSKNLQMTELSLAHVMTMAVGSRTGELYTMSTSAFYQHDPSGTTTQAGTAITPLWKSKRLTAKDWFNQETGFNAEVDADIIPTEGYIRYRSDTAITLNVYRNGGTAITFNNLSLPAQSLFAESKRFMFPLSLHCRDLELEVTLSSAQAASNTDFVFEQIKLLGEVRKRMS